jgi:cell division protein FtsB
VKYALLFLFILQGCALAWAYQNHPEAFQDALADFDHAANGARAVLVATQKQVTDLTASNAALIKENSELKADVKSLDCQVTQLKTGDVAGVTPPTFSTLSLVSKTFSPPNPLPQQKNWIWSAADGKTYKNVVILKVEADCVTILDDEGGARVYIVTLPPDIQQLLNYDPESARIAGEARVKDEIENQQLMAAELVQKQKQIAAEAGTDNKVETSLSAGEVQEIQTQISTLQSDIRQKAAEIAQSFANDGYRRISSHSAYRDAIDQDAQQINALRSKLGLSVTTMPIYYPYYPFYYYYLAQ